MTDMLNPWLTFLEQRGARFSEAPSPFLIGFGEASNGTIATTNFVAPLTDLGLIEVSGDDAATFLHNQLTNDVEHLDHSQARLAGYCTPKGRLLATMLMWRSPDGIMLQLSGDIQATVQKRLQMFVLRSKAKLADVNDTHVALGLAGDAATQVLRTWFPDMPDAAYSKTDSDAGTLIRLPDSDDMPRYQWITSQSIAEGAWDALTAKLTPVGPQAWRLGDIHAGIPCVTKITQEQFVPQMINYEIVGGVNFRKGCYPGQEIVARSQYLGKLKRRMQIATVSSLSAISGMAVFSESDPEQPCGMIVNAEAVSVGRVDCLVEIKSAMLEAGPIHLGSVTGPLMHFKPLPYELVDVT